MSVRSILLAALLYSASGSGQELAIPFEAAVLGANQQNAPVMVEIKGDAALVGRKVANGTSVAVYRRDGAGSWNFEDTLDTGAVTDVSLNPTFVEAVTVVGREVRFHKQSFPPDWVYFGTSSGVTVPEGETIRRVELEGNRLAAHTVSSGLDSAHRVRIYERTMGIWNDAGVVDLPSDGGLFGSPPISTISLQGTTLAVAGLSSGEIRLHERNAGSIGGWGEVALIDGSAAGFSDFGRSMVLAGGRLAVTARAASGAMVVEVYEQDAGGANAWGNAGRLLELPDGFDSLTVHADGDRLMVVGYPFATNFQTGMRARAWWFGPGAGPGGWVLEQSRELGAIEGVVIFSSFSDANRIAAISGDEALFGLAEPGYTGAAGWAATLYRRDIGGSAGWGLAQMIDGPGVPDGLGKAIDFHNGLLAVGMPDDSWLGTGTGSVMLWYLVNLGGGDGQVAFALGRIESPSPQAGENFGASVAVHNPSSGSFDGAFVVVGAPGRDDGRGAAYVFPIQPQAGITGQSLLPSGGLAVGDAFGASVAVGRRVDESLGGSATAIAAVGAPGDDAVAANAGAVYLFDQDLGGPSQWGQRAKRGRPAGVDGTGFGSKSALIATGGGMTLFVNRPPATGSPGRVAVFAPNEGGTNAWGLRTVITAPPGAPAGFAAGLHGSDFLVAIGATAAPGSLGKVYLYGSSAGVWTPLQEATGSASDGPSFGAEVAVSGLHLVVGAPDASGGSGRISVFGAAGTDPLTDWGLLFSRGGVAGENLGRAVGAWAIYSAAGAPGSGFWSDGGGMVRIDRAGSYEVWAKSQGLAMLPNWRPLEDADGDGQTNLVEFALGSDPLSASSIGGFRPVRGVFDPSSLNRPAMAWQTPALAYYHSLLDWRVDVSPDLQLWNLGEFRTEISGDPLERFYLLPDPVPAEMFYRLAPSYPWLGDPQGRVGGFGGGGGLILVD